MHVHSQGNPQGNLQGNRGAAPARPGILQAEVATERPAPLATPQGAFLAAQAVPGLHAGAPDGCRLTALVANATSAGKFRARLAADRATSADQWNTVTLTTLHGAVIQAAAGAPGIDNATTLLVLSLVRLI